MTSAVTAADLKLFEWGSNRCPAGFRLLAEIEVARRLLLEPEAVMLGRVLEKLGCVLEDVLGWALDRAHLVFGRLFGRLPRWRLIGVGPLGGRVADVGILGRRL